MFKKKAFIVSFLLASILLITACEPINSPGELPTPAMNTLEPGTSLPTDTPQIIPTELPPEAPLAARVNGHGIPLEAFERELQNYRASFEPNQALPSDDEIKQSVLNYLIEQKLLADAALASGFSLSDDALQEKLDSLTQDMGGADALNTWMQANHHSLESLRESLRLASLAAHQRDAIIAEVPETAEQVRARQLFSIRQGDLTAAQKSLEGGVSFEEIAWKLTPESGGELGWFPRGFLLFPEIEEVAFNLPVGSRSEIIQTDIGYHIIEILAHEDGHPLTTDARVMLQNKELENWLTTARDQAEIEILVP